MKRLFLFLVPLAFLASCNSDSDTPVEVQGCTDPNALNYNPYANVDDGSCVTPLQKQGAFAINYTATWCGPCGNWGAPRIHEMAAAGSPVVAITAHASGDPMHNSVLYGSFSSCRPTGGGIPSFWVGDIDDGMPSDVTAMLLQTPPAGLEFIAARDGNNMNVAVRSLFFQNVTGEYYLSVYLLEDGIDGSASAGEYAQNGVANPDTYKHDYVLRAAATPNSAYGEMIASGSIAAGSKFDKTYSIPVDATWNDVYVAVCLWKKDGSFYSFVNSLKKR
ncbi:MAG TPA: Omp28-related outer membrane protein [Bacteroidales bacterium]|nr:Omp28-related outer membrane protein [Bacteroidales bacterium]